MTLKALLSPLGKVHEGDGQSLSHTVRGVTADSRKVTEGVIFVAIRGARFDGHAVLETVIKNQGLALVVEDPSAIPKEFNGAWVQVANTRSALDQLAGHFYDEPSKKLFCVGVTGTNGKTTLTHMLEWIWNFSGSPMAVMGTIDHHFQKTVWPTEMTTPAPVELQSRLADFIQAGAQAVAMEVSSHALEQARAASVHFDAAVFTNLSRDHLDYHNDMESYFSAKKKLFTEGLTQSAKARTIAVVNGDDPWGARLAQELNGAVTYGHGEKSDYRLGRIHMSFEGLECELTVKSQAHRLKLPMVGHFNAMNAAAAVALADQAGLPIDKSLKALSGFPGVPGRLQKVDGGKPHVFVDYAHTPDALENVLSSLIEVRKNGGGKNKIHCVFGCGGDRDKGKRPIMAAAAAALADEVWITSDNPRTEDPTQIIEDILQGIPDGFEERLHVQVDRAVAIAECISQAHCDDVILIAGKGHEDYQVIGTEKRPFSDFDEARKALNEKTI